MSKKVVKCFRFLLHYDWDDVRNFLFKVNNFVSAGWRRFFLRTKRIMSRLKNRRLFNKYNMTFAFHNQMVSPLMTIFLFVREMSASLACLLMEHNFRELFFCFKLVHANGLLKLFVRIKRVWFKLKLNSRKTIKSFL